MDEVPLRREGVEETRGFSLGWHLLTCLERRSLTRDEIRMSGAAGDGRWREDRPSGELVSTMLTLVWAIAGIWWEVSGAGGAVAEWLTGSHMSRDMLRTSEGRLADGALVIPGHRWLFFAVAVAVAFSVVVKFIRFV